MACTGSRAEGPGGKTVHRLFWGDLHNHNAVGYGTGSLERSIDLARAHLDFFAFRGPFWYHCEYIRRMNSRQQITCVTITHPEGQGGTRVPSFWRWPGMLKPGIDVDRLAAHIDLFPTLAELAGAKVPDAIHLDGRSLVPLLREAKADWPDRYLFIHVGRWAKGEAEKSKYAKCAVRSSRFRLVNNAELYDIQADPGETKNVIDQHPQVVAAMRAAYDKWWAEVLPALENENALGPKENPFKVLYWKQFGGGPKDP